MAGALHPDGNATLCRNGVTGSTPGADRPRQVAGAMAPRNRPIGLGRPYCAGRNGTRHQAGGRRILLPSMAVKVVLRNPRREVEVAAGRRVKDVLRELDIIPETVLVIRGDTLVTGDQIVGDGDVLELRPVMSGGGA